MVKQYRLDENFKMLTVQDIENQVSSSQTQQLTRIIMVCLFQYNLDFGKWKSLVHQT